MSSKLTGSALVVACVFVVSGVTLGQISDERRACNADYKMSGNDNGDHMGLSMDASGDFDLDGKADILVSGGVKPNKPADVWLYWGFSGGSEPPNMAQIVGFETGPIVERSGGPVARFAPDLDGDSKADIVVGDPLWSGSHMDLIDDGIDTQPDCGRVIVYLSSTAGFVNGWEEPEDVGAAIIIQNDGALMIL